LSVFGEALSGLRSAIALPQATPRRFFQIGLPGERDYQQMVKEGAGNSIVGACMNFIVRTFPEAPLQIRDMTQGEPGRALARHDLLSLVRRPTRDASAPVAGHYPGIILWMATLVSFVIDGNAYWLKVRDQTGRVVQLWYVPHWMMEPRWPTAPGNTVFIDHYDYTPFGQPIPVDPSEVVHFRFGVDPENTRKGYSQLKTVIREVATDEEASAFSASLLHNYGVPGLVLSPAKDSKRVMGKDERDSAKADLIQKTTGEHRGEPLVMSLPTEVTSFGFSPQQMDLGAIRHLPEERVTSALGLPAAVIGLGSGLQGVRIGATLRELLGLAWRGCLMPTTGLLGEQLWTQLLPDFLTANVDLNPEAASAELEGLAVRFDYRKVSGLAGDFQAEADYWATMLRSEIAMRAEARSALGLPVDAKRDNVFVASPGVGQNAAGGSANGAGSPALLKSETQLEIEARRLREGLAEAEDRAERREERHDATLEALARPRATRREYFRDPKTHLVTSHVDEPA